MIAVISASGLVYDLAIRALQSLYLRYSSFTWALSGHRFPRALTLIDQKFALTAVSTRGMRDSAEGFLDRS